MGIACSGVIILNAGVRGAASGKVITIAPDDTVFNCRQRALVGKNAAAGCCLVVYNGAVRNSR